MSALWWVLGAFAYIGVGLAAAAIMYEYGDAGDGDLGCVSIALGAIWPAMIVAYSIVRLALRGKQ